MKIREITHQMRNDFAADMECEHCGHVQKLTTGYDDFFYHNFVITAMTCEKCGKNRTGEIPEVKNDQGLISVHS